MFGPGFDTATQISILATSASSASSSISPISNIVAYQFYLPLLEV